MSKPKIDKRLMHLARSGLCPHEDPIKYAVELKQLADSVAKVEETKRQSKIFSTVRTVYGFPQIRIVVNSHRLFSYSS